MDKPILIEYWWKDKEYASRRRMSGVPQIGHTVRLGDKWFKVTDVVWQEEDTDCAVCVVLKLLTK